MKMTLGTKLTAGFLGLGAVTVVVGLLGWNGVTSLKILLDETARTETIAKTFLEREMDHLNWVSKVGQFQSDETLVHLNVEKDPHKCGLGQWYYGAGRQEAERAMPQLAPVLKELEAPHQRLHASAGELEKILAEGKPARPRAIRFYQDETTAVLQEVRQLFAKLRPAIEEQARAQQTAALQKAQLVKRATTGVTLVGLALAVTLGILLSRRISAPIKAAAEALSLGAKQTTAAAGQVSAEIGRAHV